MGKGNRTPRTKKQLENAGRKATGDKTKTMSFAVPLEVAALLEQEKNKSSVVADALRAWYRLPTTNLKTVLKTSLEDAGGENAD